MTNPRALFALAPVAALLAALAGCAGNTQEPAAGSSPSNSSPTSPRSPASPSDAQPSTDSQRAAEAAVALVEDYFEVIDRVRQHPERALTALTSVATSSQLVAQRQLVTGERTKGLHQVGDTRIAALKVQSVNLDNSEPAAGKVPTVSIDVCWDVSDVDILDAGNVSVVSAQRPSRGWTRYTVANYHWNKKPSDGWRIATGQDLEREPCAAS